LFAIRKVGQRKTLFSQRKIWLGFQESVFSFGCVCFSESGFREITFQTFLCFLPLEKLVNEKYFPVKEKFNLIFKKVFPEKFGPKTLSGSCEKI
jgi:hypothetical protein